MLHPMTNPKAKQVNNMWYSKYIKYTKKKKYRQLYIFTPLWHKMAPDTSLISVCYKSGQAKQFKPEPYVWV